MTAGIKVPAGFFFLASLTAIAFKSRSHEKFSSGTKSYLIGTLGGGGVGSGLGSSGFSFSPDKSLSSGYSFCSGFLVSSSSCFLGYS